MDSLRSSAHPSKSLMELGKVSHPVQSHSVCGGCVWISLVCISRAAVPAERSGGVPSEAGRGGGRRLSHVFSFQSISPLDPGGLPPAQAARSDSSLSKGEVAFAEPNKGIKFLTFKSKSILFCSPSSKMGERKSMRGGPWLPPSPVLGVLERSKAHTGARTQ